LPFHEPIAIVGIGCRFPGVPDVESFWRVLRDGIETVDDYPGKRFDYMDRVFSADSVRRGVIASRRGGFLPDLDRFDAAFFGISPREAALLDPQQRLLLEVAWEAAEDAGIPPSKLSGSRTGVFVGLWNSDYEHCIYEVSPELEFYATTGGGRYPASGRLAYFLDLRGPNLTVDTACSSSLVAIHLACASLRSGECEMALAGGVNVIVRPEITLSYSAAKMLSPEGRCKFGDAAADGYVRSEGAGIVFLKPLSRATADHDTIYAVIRGSAVNNDGRSSGLLISPSREGQADMLRTAMRDADVAPKDLDYIEAHGTGTMAGDPVEIGAIGSVMAEGPRKRPCMVGSVKTNLGHTESAAGVAGLIKVALSLDRRTIPASLHFHEPNPLIHWSEKIVAMQTKTASWPDGEASPIAGVSGFGITGTNAHVILQGVPAPVANRETRERADLFLLSAHTPTALEAQAASWRDRLIADASWPASLPDLAYTASARRAHHDFRLALVSRTRQELLQQIRHWLAKQEQSGVCSGKRLTEERRRAVFVFPGQGGQWIGMGRTLLRDEPIFSEAMAECDEAIRKYTGWKATSHLLAEDAAGALNSIEVIQPVLFAIMVSLAALWRSYGVVPEALVGHSMGEAAAAAVCGALSLDDAAAVICHRSRLMRKASGRGLMAVAELSLEDSEKFAGDYAGRISVAANNSPSSTVLSGDADAIEDALAKLEAREIFCRRIKVDVASHCAHMDPFREELARVLKDIRPRKGSILFYSTTSGLVEDGTGLDAGYWSRNLRQPVLFSSAVQALLADGFDTFIEVNAHPVLLQAIEDGIRHADKEAVAVPSLRRDKPERAELLHALGTLYVSGFPVDLARLYPQGACLRLPPYSWQRERHWIETTELPASRGRGMNLRTDPAAVTGGVHCLYRRNWTPVERAPAAPAIPGKKSWILLGEPGPLTNQFVRQLKSCGDECVCVADAEGVRRALASPGATYHGVVRVSQARGAEPRDAAQEVSEIARLAQVLVDGKGKLPTRLWLASTGSWSLAGDFTDVAVAQGAAWGIGGVIATEHPELHCTNLDLSSAPTGDELNVFAAWLREDGHEEQIAIRGNSSFVLRLERHESASSGEPLRFSPDATYLLTGGLGQLGLKLAGWLVEHGARQLALIGRRPPAEAAQAEIQRLESEGATVRIFNADIADEYQLTAAMHAIECNMPPLRGVFHLAGLVDSAMLTEISDEHIERTIRPKAAGTWALHRHTEKMPLDFFVLFSSLSAAMGQQGLAAYASASAFLDALSHYRQKRGLKALSIQWGPWADPNHTKSETVRRGMQAYEQQGIPQLSFEQGFAAMEQLIAEDRPTVLVAPIVWREFARSFAGSPVPRAYMGLVPAEDTVTKSEPPLESIREKLIATMPGRPRRALLETHLAEVLAGVLKTDASRLDPGKPLGSMGVDSLMALQFVRRLAVTTSVRLPATAVFNYPTLKLLGAEIARRMGISLDADAQGSPAPKAAGQRTHDPHIVATLTEAETIQALLQGGERKL
jgi:acyl transferase domain-containing protein